MKAYSHTSSATGKRSGVKGYEDGKDYIKILFTSGAIFLYTVASCGEVHINNMLQLANAQRGLNTYLTKHKPRYASKSK